MSTPAPNTPDASPSWQHRLTSESTPAFAAYCLYRDQGVSRSIDKVGQELVKSGSLLSRWSAEHQWVERVRAYDQHRAEQARALAEAEHSAKIKAYRERAAKIGAATADVSLGFLVAAGKRLKSLSKENPAEGEETIKDIPINALPSFLRAAASVAEVSLRVEREALGIGELENLLGSDEDAETGSG